jgi:hypothetical protein
MVNGLDMAVVDIDSGSDADADAADMAGCTLSTRLAGSILAVADVDGCDSHHAHNQSGQVPVDRLAAQEEQEVEDSHSAISILPIPLAKPQGSGWPSIPVIWHSATRVALRQGESGSKE